MNPQKQETHLKILRILEEKPDITQRELSEILGISLGKANYCMKALIGKGMVKAENFRNSDSKSAYLYILTPKGMEAKLRISRNFLQRKIEEYDLLKQEIEELKNELDVPEVGER